MFLESKKCRWDSCPGIVNPIGLDFKKIPDTSEELLSLGIMVIVQLLMFLNS